MNHRDTEIAQRSTGFIFPTDSFSQVMLRRRVDWKPFKRLPVDFAFRGTWLKPGVNETQQTEFVSPYF